MNVPPKLLPVVIVPLTLLSACMTGPANGDAIESIDAPVTFEGYMPNPGVTVQIAAAATPAGPFTAWNGSSATASATATLSIPVGSGGTTPIYPWSVSTVVPQSRWGIESGPDGCDVRATYVTATSGPFSLYTFDAPNDTDPGGLACLVDEFLSGTEAVTALEACRSPDSPVVRLEAPGEDPLVGDVLIETQADADAIACIPEIDGNLTIAPMSPTAIDIPALRVVTGDVMLSLPVQAPVGGPFDEARCGSATPTTVWSEITRVHLPQLARIDGNLDIDAPSTGVPTTPGEHIELDLDALAELGGDLSLTFGTPAVSPCGLSALGEVPGDLTIAFANADVGGGSMLSSLTEVGGQVAVSGGFTVIGLLGNLQTAGALSLTDIPNLQPSNSLDALTTVDGLLEVHDMTVPVVTALTSAGSVLIDDTGFTDLSMVGSDTVTAGGLTLTSNANLAALGTTVDFTSSAELVVGEGNPALTNPEVCTFVAYQQTTNGWVPMGSGFSCP